MWFFFYLAKYHTPPANMQETTWKGIPKQEVAAFYGKPP